MKKRLRARYREKLWGVKCKSCRHKALNLFPRDEVIICNYCGEIAALNVYLDIA